MFGQITHDKVCINEADVVTFLALAATSMAAASISESRRGNTVTCPVGFGS